ncbi:MAG: hypothetical protein H6727_00310 [Myxococcales bacterium]|nr:hypothetical protein [Myxococcales bacterium]
MKKLLSYTSCLLFLFSLQTSSDAHLPTTKATSKLSQKPTSQSASLPVSRPVRIVLPTSPTRYFHQELVELRKLFSQATTRENRAVFAGVHWLTRYLEDNQRFREGFGDFVWIINELTLFPPSSPLAKIATRLIRKSFQRAIPQFSQIYDKDIDEKWNFLALFPLVYKYKLPLQPFLSFYDTHFTKDLRSGYNISYKKSIETLNYDVIGGYLIDGAFLDLFLKRHPNNPFRLPKNHAQKRFAQLDKLPFIHSLKSDPDGYHDQNYFITHIIMAANHYSESPLPRTPLMRRIGDYLTRELPTVRHQVDDLDLLAEYIYCLKVLKRDETPLVRESLQYMIKAQHADGSWGTDEELKGETYDAMHPTWTVLSALTYPGSLPKLADTPRVPTTSMSPGGISPKYTLHMTQKYLYLDGQPICAHHPNTPYQHDRCGISESSSPNAQLKRVFQKLAASLPNGRKHRTLRVSIEERTPYHTARSLLVALRTNAWGYLTLPVCPLPNQPPKTCKLSDVSVYMPFFYYPQFQTHQTSFQGGGLLGEPPPKPTASLAPLAISIEKEGFNIIAKGDILPPTCVPLQKPSNAAHVTLARGKKGYPFRELQKCLKRIKTLFPKTHNVTLLPQDNTPWMLITQTISALHAASSAPNKPLRTFLGDR